MINIGFRTNFKAEGSNTFLYELDRDITITEFINDKVQRNLRPYVVINRSSPIYKSIDISMIYISPNLPIETTIDSEYSEGMVPLVPLSPSYKISDIKLLVAKHDGYLLLADTTLPLDELRDINFIDDMLEGPFITYPASIMGVSNNDLKYIGNIRANKDTESMYKDIKSSIVEVDYRDILPEFDTKLPDLYTSLYKSLIRIYTLQYDSGNYTTSHEHTEIGIANDLSFNVYVAKFLTDRLDLTDDTFGMVPTDEDISAYLVNVGLPTSLSLHDHREVLLRRIFKPYAWFNMDFSRSWLYSNNRNSLLRPYNMQMTILPENKDSNLYDFFMDMIIESPIIHKPVHLFLYTSGLEIDEGLIKVKGFTEASYLLYSADKRNKDFNVMITFPSCHKLVYRYYRPQELNFITYPESSYLIYDQIEYGGKPLYFAKFIGSEAAPEDIYKKLEFDYYDAGNKQVFKDNNSDNIEDLPDDAMAIESKRNADHLFLNWDPRILKYFPVKYNKYDINGEIQIDIRDHTGTYDIDSISSIARVHTYRYMKHVEYQDNMTLEDREMTKAHNKYIDRFNDYVASIVTRTMVMNEDFDTYPDTDFLMQVIESFGYNYKPYTGDVENYLYTRIDIPYLYYPYEFNSKWLEFSTKELPSNQDISYLNNSISMGDYDEKSTLLFDKMLNSFREIRGIGPVAMFRNIDSVYKRDDYYISTGFGINNYLINKVTSKDVYLLLYPEKHRFVIPQDRRRNFEFISFPGEEFKYVETINYDDINIIVLSFFRFSRIYSPKGINATFGKILNPPETYGKGSRGGSSGYRGRGGSSGYRGSKGK